jgi:NAD(P)-dependent dehydrogenase (short-subunit alcohol dehydrogenase family)
MQLDASITAVVTGGAFGLGAATARRLASQGVKVALFDLNAELGERVAGDIGGVFCKVDVTSDAEVDAGFSRSRGLIGQERILVNCAGIGGPSRLPAATARPARSGITRSTASSA